MDSNMTFRIDSEVKAQMAAICDALGMSTSTAFNIFANAFVRAKGMPFAVTIQEPATSVSRERCWLTLIRCWVSSLPIIRGWRNDLDYSR